MNVQGKDIVDILLSDPIFSKSDYQHLSRLLPHVTRKTYDAGTRIYKSGEDASHLYILIEGDVEFVTLQGKCVTLQGGGQFGEECAADFSTYMSDAMATTQSTVLLIPKLNVLRLIGKHPSVRTELYISLMNKFAGEIAHRSETAPVTVEKGSGKLKTIGWLLNVIMPAGVFYLGIVNGMSIHSTTFLTIFTATILMWIFRLVDEYVPGLFALLASLSIGLAPTSVVLSGFASDGFFMALSFLGLGTVIVTSGLSYRFLLLLLHCLPNTKFWHNIGLLVTGFLLTPMVPSINGRIALVTPFLGDMIETLNLKRMGDAATMLSIATFAGVTILSSVFLSSKSVNFVVYGLLPLQGQDQFQWLFWFVAAAVTGGSMILLYFLIIGFLLKKSDAPQLSKEQIALQLKLLGKIRAREWAAIIGIMIFIAGIVTSTIHKIQPPWLGLAILFCLLAWGSLKKREFREKIDWPFLMYLGEVVGIIAIFNFLGLDKWIARNLAGLSGYMTTDFELFILLLAGVVFIIRLAVPISATIVIVATILMPIAEMHGINPWVAGFIILTIGEMWFFPYQCSYYLQFQDENKRLNLYDERSFLKINMLINIARIAAIYASIPYWKKLGLL